MDNELIKLYQKGLNKASSVRRTRRIIKKWLDKEMLENYVYFITFTFNDDSLKKDNLRKSFTDYLRRTCKLKCILYPDYGKKNNRLHYHGFISLNNELDLNNDYFNKYGFTKIEKLKEKIPINYVVKYACKFNDTENKYRILKINQKN